MTTIASPSMSAGSDPAPRPLPLWASIPIILACLAAGGTIIRWYVGTHLKADEPHLLGDLPARTAPVARGGGNGRNWAGWLGGGSRGIRPTNGNREGFDAFTEHARATYIIGAKNGPTLSLTYGPDSAYSFVPDDVRKTVYAAQRLTRDKKYSDAIKLTSAQVAQLQQDARTFMQVAAADRKTLLADFASYRVAKPTERGPIQTKLLADLDGVAERGKEPTRAAFADAATKINAIVTPAQWTQLKAMGLQP